LSRSRQKKIPFSDQLGGRVELHHDFIVDRVDAHLGPPLAFLVAGLATRRSNAISQLLQQNGIERHLVEAIENLAGYARRAGTFDGLIGTMIVSCDSHHAPEGDGRLPE